MNFESVFELLLDNFYKAKVDFALIGGFAVHVAGYTRATEDIDFLIAKDDALKVKKIMLSYGYELLHESEDVSNYLGRLGDLGKVDFLYAHRKYAKAMLLRAQEKGILGGKFKIKVIRPEDLIGLKVQSSSNDPRRYHQDMADIEAIMRVNLKKLDIGLIREYFALFERQKELEEILKELKNA